MTFAEDSRFTGDDNIFYRIFNRIINNITTPIKPEPHDPEKTLEEYYREIMDLDAIISEILKMLEEAQVILQKTTSCKLKKQCKYEMRTLLEQYTVYENDLNKLQHLYIEHLKAYPDTEQACRKWNIIIKEEKKHRRDVISIVNQIISDGNITK